MVAKEHATRVAGVSEATTRAKRRRRSLRTDPKKRFLPPQKPKVKNVDYMSDSGAEFGAEFGAAEYDGVMVGIPQIATLATLASQTVTVQVTQDFRAERLILNATGRTALMEVTQISISSTDQNRGDGPIPAEVFTPDASHRLRGTIVQPGVGIRITYRNGTAGNVLNIGGAFFGPAVA